MVAIQSSRRGQQGLSITIIVYGPLLLMLVVLVVVLFNLASDSDYADAAIPMSLEAFEFTHRTPRQASINENSVDHKRAKDEGGEPVEDEKEVEHEGGGSLPKSDSMPTVAYAWTLASCSDFQSSTEGMIDAALVLRHSIHRIHKHSKYGYKVYVLVHPQAAKCTKILQQAGYNVRVLDPPIDKKDIRGKHLREKVDTEWCCGSKEFIKLYAYNLDNHVIVVHVDIDFAFYQPMDELFDAMLYKKGTPERQEAESKIRTQYDNVVFPDTVEAFITRDYQQIIPGDKRSLFQAGFMVVKNNPAVFEELRQVILEGNFVEGWKSDSGWGGLGYAGKVGAKAMQGLIAYYYDIIRPNVSVELHGCRYNWMGGDILYRNVPTFYPRQFPHKVGKCRNGHETCEDCQKAKLENIQSVHYTNCRKPWNCIGIKWEKGQAKSEQGIDERNSVFDKCMEVIEQWHLLREDLENQVSKELGWRNGTYKQTIFRGHCHGNGQKNYVPLSRFIDPSLVPTIYKET